MTQFLRKQSQQLQNKPMGIQGNPTSGQRIWMDALCCLSKVSHFLLQPMSFPIRVLCDASPVALRVSTIMGLEYLLN